jgi:hypothetical protein
MPVSTRWDNDQKNIMLWVFEGRWTWNDYYECRDDVNADIAAMTHTVHIIVDMRTSNTLPNSVITHGHSAVSQPPRNLGLTVIVGVNPVLRAFYGMFSRLYTSLLVQKRVEMHMVRTIEEAYALIDDYQSEATR